MLSYFIKDEYFRKLSCKQPNLADKSSPKRTYARTTLKCVVCLNNNGISKTLDLQTLSNMEYFLKMLLISLDKY